MCVKKCECNNCYKRNSCTGCPHNAEHKNVDCYTDGVQGCLFKIKYPNVASDAAAEIIQDIAAPVLRKHDYRDVWIDANTTITIDHEDLKEQMRRDFYKSVGLPGLVFWA